MTEKEQAIINQSQEVVPINSVFSHPKNVRQGDIGAIIDSIKNNGFYGTLIVQRSTNYILKGNHTWRAALELGYEEIPVCFVDVDDERALRILLADNRTSDVAEYDEKGLAELLLELSHTEESLEGTGFTDADYEDLLEFLGENQTTTIENPTNEDPIEEPGDEASDTPKKESVSGDTKLSERALLMKEIERVLDAFSTEDLSEYSVVLVVPNTNMHEEAPQKLEDAFLSICEGGEFESDRLIVYGLDLTLETHPDSESETPEDNGEKE